MVLWGFPGLPGVQGWGFHASRACLGFRVQGLQEVEGSNTALLWSIRDDRGAGASGSAKECIPEIISR